MSEKISNQGNLLDVTSELERARQSLRTLRDELRVKAHLMGMDTKEMFDRIEKEIENTERQTGSKALKVIHDLIDDAKAIARSIHRRQS